MERPRFGRSIGVVGIIGKPKSVVHNIFVKTGAIKVTGRVYRGLGLSVCLRGEQ